MLSFSDDDPLTSSPRKSPVKNTQGNDVNIEDIGISFSGTNEVSVCNGIWDQKVPLSFSGQDGEEDVIFEGGRWKRRRRWNVDSSSFPPILKMMRESKKIYYSTVFVAVLIFCLFVFWLYS